MKKIALFLALTLATTTIAERNAHADSIRGRLGVTGRVGILVPADNDSDFFHNRTDTGLVGGGGVIYGLDDRLAVDAELSRTTFGSETGDFGVTDFSIGGQYRLQSRARLVPYLGVGLDILMADYDPYDGSVRSVDTTLGVHLAAGVDYFIQRQIALTGEAKVVLAPTTAITNRFGDHVGNFDPSSFSSTVGLRFFFN